jgi:hypothetical protein
MKKKPNAKKKMPPKFTETFAAVSANSADLADIMDRLYGWKPEATLEDVRSEMEVIEEALELAEEEFGVDAALAAIR